MGRPAIVTGDSVGVVDDVLGFVSRHKDLGNKNDRFLIVLFGRDLWWHCVRVVDDDRLDLGRPERVCFGAGCTRYGEFSWLFFDHFWAAGSGEISVDLSKNISEGWGRPFGQASRIEKQKYQKFQPKHLNCQK